jgi:flagellar biosynthetic protein FliP
MNPRAGWMLIALLLWPLAASAAGGLQLRVQSTPAGAVQISLQGPQEPRELSSVLQMLIALTVLSLAPALLVMCTSFTRILVVLSFLRQALGTHNLPPNQIMIAIALFLTAFSMLPVWQQINANALQPYQQGRLNWQQASSLTAEPVREFMLKQTRPRDLALFVKLSRQERPKSPREVPLLTLIPAFMMSELRIAFQIGFLLYLPFLVVDMVVASILLSMGMMMLPPVMISLPFKILLFVLVDGWNLLTVSLLRSFH